jgi:hypothetical protein
MPWEAHISAVLITGILGLCAVVIAALVTRNKIKYSDNTQHYTAERTLCPEHSGLVALIQSNASVVSEIREDVRSIKSHLNII